MIKDKFRENVAAIIINKDKKVLMCEHAWIDDAWQFPQGGVDKGEKEDDAIVRELFEELGTKSFKIISKMDKQLKYIFPFYLKEKYQFNGQKQKYYLLYFTGDESEIKFDNQEKPEFKAFKWVDYDEPPKYVIYFKKLAYLAALKYFKKTLDEVDLSKFK